jgi:hypothetical protein
MQPNMEQKKQLLVLGKRSSLFHFVDEYLS